MSHRRMAQPQRLGGRFRLADRAKALARRDARTISVAVKNAMFEYYLKKFMLELRVALIGCQPHGARLTRQYFRTSYITFRLSFEGTDIPQARIFEMALYYPSGS